MVCLYPAAKAMMKALKTLNETRDVMSLGNIGPDWVVVDEIVGLDGDEENLSSRRERSLLGNMVLQTLMR